MGLNRLKKASQSIEAMNQGQQEAIGTEPRSRHYRRTSGPRFEDRYQRITTYLENNLFRQVESLREQGKILNLTAFFNQALVSYLNQNYGGN